MQFVIILTNLSKNLMLRTSLNLAAESFSALTIYFLYSVILNRVAKVSMFFFFPNIFLIFLILQDFIRNNPTFCSFFIVWECKGMELFLIEQIKMRKNKRILNAKKQVIGNQCFNFKKNEVLL